MNAEQESGDQNGGQIGRAPPDLNTSGLRQARETSDADIVSWFQKLFETGVTLGSFFAGFTLNIVTAASGDERAMVRTFASVSSLLFVLTVLVCSGCNLYCAFNTTTIKWRGSLVALMSFVLQLILLTAILFFFLVMKEYVWVVGWLGVAFTGIAMLVAFGLWVV